MKFKLGAFTFTDLEIPEELAIAREQKLVVHDLVGGGRVVDAMGTQLKPIEWTGWLLGKDAFDRAKQLAAMCEAGQVVALDAGRIGAKVIVQTFTYRFQTFYKIPYSITVLPLPPAASAKAASVNQAIDEDMDEAEELAEEVADPGITGKLGTLKAAISSVSDFAKATTAQIQSVLQPLNEVRGQVTTLIASVANTANNIATVGGLFPNNPAAQAVGKIINQTNVYSKLPALLQLQAVTGRMANNVGSSSSAGEPVATAGGNLMKIAADKYGDPMAWTGIARANNLTDPVLTGAKVITVPPQPDTNGGVIQT
ncbi:hypothetical protein [Chitinimonas naiadis]